MACWVSAMINALGKHVFRRFFSRVQAFLKATVIRRCLKQELGGGGMTKILSIVKISDVVRGDILHWRWHA